MGRAVLYTESGSEHIVEDEETNIPIEHTYVKVEIETDKFFAFYNKTDYGSGSTVQLLQSGPHDLQFSPRSARDLPYKADCILLFGHVQYCGPMKLYYQNNSDINEDFPSGTAMGVSSAINWGHDAWKLCDDVNFHGEGGELATGNYPYHSDLKIGGDKAQSVKRI